MDQEIDIEEEGEIGNEYGDEYGDFSIDC